MKQLIALLLVLSLACLPALAEKTSYGAMGLSFDADAVVDATTNHITLIDEGVMSHDPYLATLVIYYYSMTPEVFRDLSSRYDTTEDEEEASALLEKLNSRMHDIAMIFVTDANTPAEAGIVDPLPDGFAITEFGTFGAYHYYCITCPTDDVLAVYDTDAARSEYGDAAEAEKEKTRADVERVLSELSKQLQAAEFSEPVDPDKSLVGQVIDFESVDLDGNAVKSADLFKDNKITMVNLWGTWCHYCLGEMAELAKLHTRLQEKGCGIVGVEYEQMPIDMVADTARQIISDNGITYPNVIVPGDNAILNNVAGYPTTFLVDSTGRILTYPISGAAVELYEPTIDKLLAGEEVEASDTGAAAGEGGEYRVIVCDVEGNPVKGVIVQLCDDTTCSYQKTKADGVATFQVETPKVYEVHVGKVPEGYQGTEEVFKTQETYSELNIVIEKAE